MSASSSPLSTQKTLKTKKNILPRASLIQVFNELPAPNFNNPTDLTQCNLNNAFATYNKGNTTGTNSIQEISFASTVSKPPTSFTVQSTKTAQRTLGTNDFETEPRSSPSTKFKRQKFTKESKFKEITRLCLYQTQSSNKLTDSQAGIDTENSSIQPIAPQPRTKQSLIQFIAKDFLTDGRQRLDLDTFTKLLMLLKTIVEEDTHTEIGFDKNLRVLSDIYRLIENDFNLCNKFSSFLTCETALHFGLFTQYCQYEKCYEFLQKLEIFIPNKCTFKKLIQSILTSCNSSYEHETVPDKIEEIKSKIKAVTKNNALIDFELEYLFDQRWANLEPTYEKISLIDAYPITNNSSESKNVNIDPKKLEPVSNEVPAYYEEFIDLTNGASSALRKKQMTINATTATKTGSKLKKKTIAKSKYENKSLFIALKKHVE